MSKKPDKNQQQEALKGRVKHEDFAEPSDKRKIQVSDTIKPPPRPAGNKKEKGS